MLIDPTGLSWIGVFQSQAAAGEAVHTMSVDPQCHLQETKDNNHACHGTSGWPGVAPLLAATVARLLCTTILSTMQGEVL